MPKMVSFDDYLKTFRQTVLLDMSLLIDQKLVENATIEKFNFEMKKNLYY